MSTVFFYTPYPRSYFETKGDGEGVAGTVARSNCHRAVSGGDAAELLYNFAHPDTTLTLVGAQMIKNRIIIAAHNSEYSWLDH